MQINVHKYPQYVLNFVSDIFVTTKIPLIVISITKYWSWKGFQQQVTVNIIQGHWQWCHSIVYV